MVKISTHQLGPVPETALVALYYRALDNREPDPILRDPCALQLVEQLDFDFSSIHPSPMSRVLTTIRTRQFDRNVAAFLSSGRPSPVVVEIGCGLDTRYERLGCPDVHWYSLDLPEVIVLRQQLLATFPKRTELAYSALDFAWLDCLPPLRGESFFFLAEGVFEYFEESDVRSLALAIRDRYPGAELLFTTVPFIEERLSSLHPALRGRQARVRWGMRLDRLPESWAQNIRLLESWRYFDQPDPYLRPYRWMAWIPWFGKEWRLVRYRLGGKSQSSKDDSF